MRRRILHGGRGLFISGAFILALCSGADAQEVQIPVDLEVELFSKIVGFERRIVLKEELVVGLVYQASFRASEQLEQDFMVAAERSQRMNNGGLKLRIIPILADEGLRDFESSVPPEVEALYVAPLRSFDIGVITSFSRKRGILTLTGVPEYVSRGIAIGLRLKGGRPNILINLSAVKAEGADFSSRLLNVADIIP